MRPVERLAVVREQLEERKRVYNQRLGQQRQLLREKEELERQLLEVKERQQLLEKVRTLLHKVSEYARQQACREIEQMITSALQSVFNSDIKFRIETSETRGRTEMEFYVVSSYGGAEVVTRPQDARGGGVVDVVSLALRIALLQIYRPLLPGPIILDEPAKHVSEEYAGNVAYFLKNISQYFQRQIIMVTHNQTLAEAADRSFLVEMKDGISHVQCRT